jgi:hypothetical protein
MMSRVTTLSNPRFTISTFSPLAPNRLCSGPYGLSPCDRSLITSSEFRHFRCRSAQVHGTHDFSDFLIFVRFLTPVPPERTALIISGFHLGFPRSCVHGNTDFPMRQMPMALDLRHVPFCQRTVQIPSGFRDLRCPSSPDLENSDFPMADIPTAKPCAASADLTTDGIWSET